jgi:hypothetical protein
VPLCCLLRGACLLAFAPLGFGTANREEPRLAPESRLCALRGLGLEPRLGLSRLSRSRLSALGARSPSELIAPAVASEVKTQRLVLFCSSTCYAVGVFVPFPATCVRQSIAH